MTIKERLCKIKNTLNIKNWGLSFPSGNETAVNTAVVIGSMAAISGIIFCMDSVYSLVLQIIV